MTNKLFSLLLCLAMAVAIATGASLRGAAPYEMNDPNVENEVVETGRELWSWGGGGWGGGGWGRPSGRPSISRPLPSASPPDIVEKAQDTPALSTLVSLLEAADLVETLQGDGPFTVFAPTNDGRYYCTIHVYIAIRIHQRQL